MTSETEITTVEHLVCNDCDDGPRMARLDADLALICHCTHVDGTLNPVPVTNPISIPDAWEFVEEGGPA